VGTRRERLSPAGGTDSRATGTLAASTPCDLRSLYGNPSQQSDVAHDGRATSSPQPVVDGRVRHVRGILSERLAR